MVWDYVEGSVRVVKEITRKQVLTRRPCLKTDPLLDQRVLSLSEFNQISFPLDTFHVKGHRVDVLHFSLTR